MAFSYTEHTSALPGYINPMSISHPKLTSNKSPAILKPGTEVPDNAMPPLPPLRYAPGCSQPQQQPDDMSEKREYCPGRPSFASGHGSMASSSAVNGSSYQQRSGKSLPQEFGLQHALFQFQSPADIHAESVKKRLGFVRNVNMSPLRSLLIPSATDLLSRRPSRGNRCPPTFSEPEKLPFITSGVPGSPAHLTVAPLHPAVSPRITPFRSRVQSPNDNADMDRVPRTQTKRNNNDGATSMQQSYHVNKLQDIEMEESQSLKQFHTDDARRAKSQRLWVASTLDKSSLHVQPNLSRVHDMRSHGSPTSHLATLPRAASVPPVSTSRSSFCTSTTYTQAPSLTTAKTFGCRSPVSRSPAGVCVMSRNSPDNIPTSVSPSPGTSVSDPGVLSSRGVIGAKIQKIAKMQKPGGSKMQRFFIWECYPKRQKKYECSACGTGFGNMNEAKRHLNSLHHRRRSWSCSALSGYNCAFYDSPDQPGQTDTCCYCGDEFPRSGLGPSTATLSDKSAHRYVTDDDWDKRTRHLKQVHRFGECNSFKKFYRADHFRQHLKHSHTSKSGKWINVLETACMLDEDLAHECE
ncbi:hypothetical protein ACKAV7_014642 [Fusarium commune]